MEITENSSLSTAPHGPYDETAYPSSAFPETHPDALCALGRLFGINAPEPATAHVLELGCGDGTNLLAMAQHTPKGRFVGIDLSSRNVATAQAAIGAAKLSNVEIRQQDVMNFPASEGKFDYIVVHGLFSWVPEATRGKILAICRENLVNNGIAYVSYNALPGWGMRMALRDMMLFHTGGIADGKAKVEQARALTAYLADAVPAEGNPYGLLLKQELERMSAQPDGYIRHDILGDVNEPLYFYQFMQRALKVGMQYMGESSISQMLASNFPEKVSKTLDRISGNIIAKEQYMDFVRNRSFRRTLLCHAEIQLQRNLTPESLKRFYFRSIIAKPEVGSISFQPGINHSFRVRSGGDLVLNTENSFVKAVFDTLADCLMKRLSFWELLDAARAKTAAASELAGNPQRAMIEEATLAANLLSLVTKGIADIYADRPELQVDVPKYPKATPLARYQALHAPVVVNRVHNPVPIDLIGRYVLAGCDGERDHPALVAYLLALVQEGKLRISEEGAAVGDENRLRQIVAAQIDRLLPQMAAIGFFAS